MGIKGSNMAPQITCDHQYIPNETSSFTQVVLGCLKVFKNLFGILISPPARGIKR